MMRIDAILPSPLMGEVRVRVFHSSPGQEQKPREQSRGFFPCPFVRAYCRKMAAVARERLRVQQRRRRAGGWTPDRERRFIEALAATDEVPLAARQVGITPVSAYRHRLARPDFAFRWRLAVRVDHAEMGMEWMETVIAMLDGEPLRPDA